MKKMEISKIFLKIRPNQGALKFQSFFIILLLSILAINSVFSQTEKNLPISESNPNDQIGYAVSLTNDGNIALIGVPNYDLVGEMSGAIYMFSREDESWKSNEDWIKGGDDSTQGDQYGFSVSLSEDGNFALVGAPNHEHLLIDGMNPAQDEILDNSDKAGAAFLLGNNTQVSGTFQQLAEMYGYSSDDALFGYSVDLSSDGNTLLIGAPQDNNYYGMKTGSAFIFTQNGPSAVNFVVKLEPEDPVADSLFGRSVALSSDGRTALIGAPNQNTAYIYSMNENGDWEELGKLEPSDGGSGNFGWSVALNTNGSTALVGRSSSDNDGAYIFQRDKSHPSLWVETHKFSSSDHESGDLFGWSVSLNGNGTSALISAPENDGSGAVYWFIWEESFWKQYTKLTASDKTLGDQFGWSTSLSSDGKTALIGAPEHGGTGAVYAFDWDRDRDGYSDREDNCLFIYNSRQIDRDNDGIGDACETMDLHIFGIFSYNENQSVPLQFKAQITEAQTNIPLSEVNAVITIYDLNGNLIFDETMDEYLEIPGIYVWVSPYNLEDSHLAIGSYLIKVSALNGEEFPPQSYGEFIISPIDPKITETITITTTSPPNTETITETSTIADSITNTETKTVVETIITSVSGPYTETKTMTITTVETTSKTSDGFAVVMVVLGSVALLINRRRKN